MDRGIEFFLQYLDEGKIKYDNGKLIRLYTNNYGGRFLKGPKEMKELTRHGYIRCQMKIEGVYYRIMAHRIIYAHFNGLHSLKEKDLVINHKDGNKQNNRIENLELVSHKENINHAKENGLSNYVYGEEHGRAKLTKEKVLEIKKKISLGFSNKEIAKQYKVSPSAIYLIKKKEKLEEHLMSTPINDHHKKCLLGTNRLANETTPICKLAGTEYCHSHCDFFIGLHGASGENGRNGFSDMSLENRLVTIQNSNVREKQPEAYKLLDLYDNSFHKIFDQTADPKSRVKNLYLYSESPGTGKTKSASACLNSFLIKYYLGSLKRNLQPQQRPIYFLDINQFQTDYNQMTRPGVPTHIREEAGERYYSKMEIVKNSLLVCFDDIGIRSVSEAFRSDLLDCINHRMSKMLPSIFTSNIPLEGLPEIFGEERLFDRIRDLAITIHFEGSSHRGRRT